MIPDDAAVPRKERWRVCPSPLWLKRGARVLVGFYFVKGLAWLGIAAWTASVWPGG